MKRCAIDLGEEVTDEEIDEMIAMAHLERKKRDKGENLASMDDSTKA